MSSETEVEFTADTYNAIEAETKSWRVANKVNDMHGRTTRASLWADHKAAFEAGVRAAQEMAEKN